MIAAIQQLHQDHRRAVAEVDRRLARGESMILASPTLVETYSVLTRVPPPNRLSPNAAWVALETTFLDAATEIVALDAAAYRDLLSSAPGQGTAGGRIYDAVIVACALAARVDTILTFNDRQFVPLAAGAIEIVVPAE